MKCPRCQAQNDEGARFCEDCGARLELACPSCGEPVGAGKKFCRSCGAALTAEPSRFASPEAYTPKHLAEKILTSKSALEGERKQVTVLFADLKGSMELLADRDPEEARKLLDPVLERMMEAVHHYEGTVNQVMGDGIMALFGAPLAHEDHAVRACYAALRMQESVKQYAQEVQRTEGVPIQIRVGVNSGKVVVRSIGSDLHMDYTAIGQTTHLAGRMEQIAMPGSILITSDALRLAEGYVQVKLMGPVTVKGLSKPVEVFEIIGAGPVQRRMEAAARRGLSQFVGRATELEVLRQALEKSRAGHGEVVAVVGEAGMGKSRLLFEFHQSLAEQRVTYLEGRCVPYGRTVPYLPMLEMLRANCRLIDTDSPEAIAEKVCRSLEPLGMDAEEALPYLLRLLGVKERTERLEAFTPEAINARTFEILWQMSLNGSRRRPLIVVIDDLQWIDKASEGYVASLVESLPGAPILLLLTYRPGYRQPWMGKSYVTRIALRPISPKDGRIVLHSVLPTEPLPEPLEQLILEKAEGNPFFLEELARALREYPDLRPTMAIPDTIQGVLMARIDRLPDEPKRLLQDASVLGREFSLGLLSAIWESPGDPVSHLRELMRLEFLYEQTKGAGPVYVFKHTLTQEVAYESLSVSRRQALHGAAGRALETLYAGRLQEVHDRLAYQYSKTEEAEKAVKYLTILANKAARGFAHMEAVAAVQEALAHVERLPIQEQDQCLLDLVLLQAHSLFLLGRFPEALEILLPHRERLDSGQDASRAARYYFLLANTYNFLGDAEAAVQSARRSIEAAERCGDEATMGKAYYVLAVESYSLGQPHQGIEHGWQAVSLLERAQGHRWLGQAHWALGINYVVIGSFEQALEAFARAQAIGDAIDDPRLQKSVAWSTGFILAAMGEWEAAVSACQRALDSSPNPLNTVLASGFLGYAYLERGEPALAIPMLEQTVAQVSQFQLRQNQGWFTTFLSEAYLLDGQTEKALHLASQGLQIVRDAKFLYGVGWVQRTLGRIARARGTLSEAETHLEEAMKTFGSVQARFEIGRTHLDLAQVAGLKGSRKVVATHVREAHSLFRALRVPKYVERAEQLSKQFGVPLSEERSTQG